MITTRVFDGRAYRVEKHNLLRDATTAFPNESILLASEIVVDGDTSLVEVWLLVPVEAVVTVVEPDPPPRQVTILPGETVWPVEVEEEYEITVEELDD